MEIFQIVFEKVGIMYSFIMVGFFLFKIKIINRNIVQKLSFILVWIINPIIIFGQYQTEFSEEKFSRLLISFILSIFAISLGFFIGNKFTKNSIERLGLGLPNSGFIGIPLVASIIGNHAVFYLSAYLAVFNITAYTYGIYLITKKANYISIKRIIKNPGIISVILGIMMFIFSVRIPLSLSFIFNFSIKVNAPLAMIILGTYIANMDIVELLKDRRIYTISFIKLIIIPLMILILFIFIPFVPVEIKYVILLATCTPVGLTASLYSQLFGGNYVHAAKLIGLSTILSLFTIPVFVYVMELVIR